MYRKAVVRLKDRMEYPDSGRPEASRRDNLPSHAAARDHAPARRLERRVNQFRSGFGFVQGCTFQISD